MTWSFSWRRGSGSATVSVCVWLADDGGLLSYIAKAVTGSLGSIVRDTPSTCISKLENVGEGAAVDASVLYHVCTLYSLYSAAWKCAQLLHEENNKLTGVSIMTLREYMDTYMYVLARRGRCVR